MHGRFSVFSVILAGSPLSQKSICEGKNVKTISVTHSCPAPNLFPKPNGLKGMLDRFSQGVCSTRTLQKTKAMSLGPVEVSLCTTWLYLAGNKMGQISMTRILELKLGRINFSSLIWPGEVINLKPVSGDTKPLIFCVCGLVFDEKKKTGIQNTLTNQHRKSSHHVVQFLWAKNIIEILVYVQKVSFGDPLSELRFLTV